MTALLGVNVGPPWESDPNALGRTGGTWVRAVYRDNIEYRPWLLQLGQSSTTCQFIFDSSPESLGDDESQWISKMAAARDRYGDLVKCWQAGNEPDGAEDSPAAWRMTKARVNHLLRRARKVFPPDSGWTLVAPGLVSGDPGWLEDIRLDLVDAIDVHPYNKFVSSEAEVGELSYMLLAYHNWWGKPLWLGEYDSRTDNLSSYFRDFPGVERAAVFCWDSVQTAGEGVDGMGINDNPRAMAEFVEATGGHEEWVGYILGFARWASWEPWLLGTPLRNERPIDQGWTTQPTSNGVLNWVEGKGHSFTTHDGRIFRWTEDRTSSWKI